MSFQIVKGWPSDGAIDVLFAAASGVTLTVGSIASIDADGNGIIGDYNTDGSDAGLSAAFIIDVDTITNKFMALMSPCLIEVDADHYAANTYVANDNLSVVAGKFAKVSGSQRVVGKVLSVNATSGTLKILWFPITA